MPEYRDIKDPTRLVAHPLTPEEAETVAAKGNEGAAGVPVGNPGQLNLWWLNDKTLVKPFPDDKEADGWSLTGYISPEAVVAEYLNRVHPELLPPAPEPAEEEAPEEPAPEPEPVRSVVAEERVDDGKSAE